MAMERRITITGDRKELLNNLDYVQKFTDGSKVSRLLANPLKYVRSIFAREIKFKITGKGSKAVAKTFFGPAVKLELPASTDIFLSGAKTHPSEIGLARWMIQNISDGDTFIDVGAHVGFFSLLANKLAGSEGMVIAFEPSPSTFKLMQLNTTAYVNIKAMQKVVSDKEEEISFFEFPALYSEYNSTNVDQYKDYSWFQKNKPNPFKIESIKLDSLLKQDPKIKPNLIKIDVEGGEYRVIIGAKQLLEKYHPSVIMEFNFHVHKKIQKQYYRAAEYMRGIGYKAFKIELDGSALPIDLAIENTGTAENILFTHNN